MPRVILASTSPYRKALLERLGIPFEGIAPTCDEEALKDPSLAPQALAEFLAKAKAQSIAATHADAVIIGSDQLAHVDGTILGKPGTADKAAEQLRLLRGRAHQLITAVHICHPDGEATFCDITTLHMRDLSDAEIERYIAHDEPLNCAASYKLECQGIALFDRIESDDHSAITGLPLLATCSLLRELGVQIP